ncbi:uncharacterized protein LOC111378338 [Olea europaea subsp. europaea]|uniref:Uncharacterized protein LOC111378338 n=1 Tax=Olea europaea subsp. europaea TaxID=158383 RepID=A0A8S0Q5C1_OLEEU|nr:uncharacterized protein LOC111378338 [Olea europaea subsp. europaea]
MSGGVGPPRDTGVAKEEEHEPAVITAVKAPTGGRFFTFRQLNALAVIIVVSASGLVSIEDLAFVIFSIIYMYFISKFAFPPPPPSSKEPPVFSEKNKFLSLYVFVGVLIGLFFPIAYIFEGIFEGDKVGVEAAAPHVFLLASQVFMEGLASAGGFSLPIRNSRRIFNVVEWVGVEISKVEAGGSSRRRVQIGRGLAVANLVYWCFNLFGFLLPVFLPKALKIYYTYAKIKE